MYRNIGFIGCGNMGGALAKCAAEGIKRLGGELFLSSASGIRANKLACELNGNAVTNDFIAANCDLIFIGVKPQMLSDMLESIRSTLEKRTTAFTMVSMVAGVTLERLRELIGVSCSLIRIMPNTPSSVGAGMIPYCCDGVSDSEEAELVSLMSSSGLWDRLPENLLDAAGCVSGCGPAFLCLALEGMADGGVALGLPRDKSIKYAAQTLLGLGKLAVETELHPGVLKDQVTSPGGTTIQGVRTLEGFSVRSAFMEAVIAAYEKTVVLKENT